LQSVSGLWSNWNSANHLRCYLKKIDTHAKGMSTVEVPFFGISHYYPGKPKITQEFKLDVIEHENLVMMELMEKWMNLIQNVDDSHKTPNDSMFATAETIYDLSCTVDIMNRGINGKYLHRYTSFTCAFPVDITAGTMSDMTNGDKVTKTVTFKCLLSLTKKAN